MGPVVIVPLIVAGVGSIVTAITIKLNKLQKRQAEFIKEENRKAHEEMKRKLANDPKNYVQVKAQVFQKYLQNLEKYEWKSKIDKQPSTVYHMILGKLSAGKSSLLNQVFDKQLATGVGDTTKQITCIGQFSYKNSQYKVDMFDTPGLSDQFTAYNQQMLVLIRDMDKVFICYKNSLKDIEDLLKILKRIKMNTSSIVLIRTQCDQFDQGGLDKTLKQELQVDYKYLKYYIGLQCQICAHSSKKDANFQDNVRVQKLMKNIEQL